MMFGFGWIWMWLAMALIWMVPVGLVAATVVLLARPSTSSRRDQ
jgi:hypothetical protein